MTKRKNDDILDKILRNADNASRQSGNGVWVEDCNHPDGGRWVTNNNDWQELSKSVEDIEKYLRA